MRLVIELAGADAMEAFTEIGQALEDLRDAGEHSFTWETTPLSDEAAAVLAAFVHLPTDEHECIFAADRSWEQLREAFPESLVDEQRKQDEDFFQEST